MINLEFKPHYYQKQILKKLLYSPKGLRFNDLLIEGLESEHMNYHLKKLVDYELVEKQNEQYCLTNKGKDYVNLLDDSAKAVERMPKVSVLIKVYRFNNEKCEMEYLVYKKLRQPYYGKVFSLGGKVRFGEKMEDAARRELYEETGISVGKIKLEEIYRKIRSNEKTECVQDVIFFCYLGEEPSGKLIEESEAQVNFWATSKELKAREDCGDDFKPDYNEKPLEYIENIGTAKDF